MWCMMSHNSLTVTKNLNNYFYSLVGALNEVLLLLKMSHFNILQFTAVAKCSFMFWDLYVQIYKYCDLIILYYVLFCFCSYCSSAHEAGSICPL